MNKRLDVADSVVVALYVGWQVQILLSYSLVKDVMDDDDECVCLCMSNTDI